MPPANKPRIRLYVPFPLAQDALVEPDAKQSHYVTHVMRCGTGDTVTVFNGSDGEWNAEIISVQKKSITLSLREQIRPQQASPDLWLLTAPLRSSKTEYVVEKATELGISRFVPVSTQFTVATSINQSRLEAIATEAAEQCERLDVPVIEPLVSLDKLLGRWDRQRTIIYGDETGTSHQPKDFFPTLKSGSYAVLIGPEGGFAPGELDLLCRLDYITGICMGPRILRADTAAISAITLLQSWLGDWDHKPAFRSTI